MTLTQRHETTTAVRLNPPGTTFGKNLHRVHGPRWCPVLVDALGGTAGQPVGFVARTRAEESALEEAARQVLTELGQRHLLGAQRMWGYKDGDEETSEFLEEHRDRFPDHASKILRPGLFQRLAGEALRTASASERAARSGVSESDPRIEVRKRLISNPHGGVVEYQGLTGGEGMGGFLRYEVLLARRRVAAFCSDRHAALFAGALLDALDAGDPELLAEIEARRPSPETNATEGDDE